MAHLVTSKQDKDHVTSTDARRFNAASLGSGKYLLKDRDNLACSVPDPNTLRIQSGSALCDGAYWSVEEQYEEYTIENGSPGYKRIDMAVADIVTTPKEEINIIILKGKEVASTAGNPVAPTYIDGDLNAGDTHVQMPICTIEHDGVNTMQPKMVMSLLTPSKDARDSLSTDLAKITTRTTALETGVTGLKSTVKQQIVANHVVSKAYSATANQTISVVASFNVGSREPFLAGWDTGNINMTIMSMTMSKGSVTAILRNLSGTTQSGTMKFSVMGVMAKLAS